MSFLNLLKACVYANNLKQAVVFWKNFVIVALWSILWGSLKIYFFTIWESAEAANRGVL